VTLILTWFSQWTELVGWSNELVVEQPPASKNVSTEAWDIVDSRHHATIGENTAD
jgi:hypothetical protein